METWTWSHELAPLIEGVLLGASCAVGHSSIYLFFLEIELLDMQNLSDVLFQRRKFAEGSLLAFLNG